MGYAGSLGEIDLASALQVLCRSRKSGLLSVEGEDCNALILLHEGRIVFASSDRVSPIGQRFVQKGLVTQEKLNEVLEVQRRKRKRKLLGPLLCGFGLVERHVAAAEIEAHVVDVLRDTLTWTTAHVHFDEAEGEVDEILPPVRCDVDSLLLRATLES